MKGKVNKKLQEILDKFKKEIKPEEFEFSTFVEEFDFENNCGTVCCIAGWFPKLFPEAGLVWKPIFSYIRLASNNEIHLEEDNEFQTRSIDIQLARFIGCETWLINVLFYGIYHSHFSEGYKAFEWNGGDYDAVITLWEYVIENYDEEKDYKV